MTATFLLIVTDSMEIVKRAGGWASTFVIEKHYIIEGVQVTAADFEHDIFVTLSAQRNNTSVLLRTRRWIKVPRRMGQMGLLHERKL